MLQRQSLAANTTATSEPRRQRECREVGRTGELVGGASVLWKLDEAQAVDEMKTPGIRGMSAISVP